MSTIFDFVAAEIEKRSNLGKLEARGTVRLALKEAGFDADAITAQQMAVVLEKLMPGALTSRGVENAGGVCTELAASIRDFKDAVEEHGSSSPESVFARLAGNGSDSRVSR
jgi:hypothetical protein